MICLCCQLSLLIGARAVPEVIQCFAATYCTGAFTDQVASFYQHNEAQRGKLNRTGIVSCPAARKCLSRHLVVSRALQKDHGRGRFTRLLAVFATQFDECTVAKSRERFTRVLNKDVKAWLKSTGPTNSTQSRHTRAYAHARTNETLFSAA